MLPTRRQIQTVADFLRTCQQPKIDPELLTDPWAQFYKYIQRWIGLHGPDPEMLQEDFFHNHGPYGVVHLEGFREKYRDLIEDAIQNPIYYPPATEMLAAIDDLRWLWEGWLLQGMPSLFAAAPGTGKSYLALDLAHRIIAGSVYPDNQIVKAAGPVLYVDAENTPTIHKQRMTHWPKAISDRLFIMLPDGDRYLINLDEFKDRDRLLDMAYAIRPTLIIIDSYGACTLKGENNKEDVQSLLAFFNYLTQTFDCGLIVIHHLRKGQSGAGYLPLTIDAVRGSSHIVAMARHVWGLQLVPSGPDDNPNDPRRLWIMKSNVGAAPQGLGVQFKPHPADKSIAQLGYTDEPKPYKDPTKTDECADWIVSELMDAGRPIRPADFEKMGKEAGYSRSLIHRAKKSLGDMIQDTETQKHHKHNAWALTDWSNNED